MRGKACAGPRGFRGAHRRLDLSVPRARASMRSQATPAAGGTTKRETRAEDEGMDWPSMQDDAENPPLPVRRDSERDGATIDPTRTRVASARRARSADFDSAQKNHVPKSARRW